MCSSSGFSFFLKKQNNRHDTITKTFDFAFTSNNPTNNNKQQQSHKPHGYTTTKTTNLPPATKLFLPQNLQLQQLKLQQKYNYNFNCASFVCFYFRLNESLNKFARNFKLDEPPQPNQKKLKNQPDNPSPQPPIESEINNLQLTTTITKPTTTLIYLRQTVLLTNASSFRLWAEVFHVSASGAGTVKWQQVSEDLVPVNITCIQDSPECIFHITAYNSQVDKILDVRLVQPGEKLQTPHPALSHPFS